jgi:hypothetical protein
MEKTAFSAIFTSVCTANRLFMVPFCTPSGKEAYLTLGSLAPSIERLQLPLWLVSFFLCYWSSGESI